MRTRIEIVFLVVLIGVFIYVGRDKLPLVYHNWGINYYERGLYKQAIVYFKNSLKFKPDNTVTQYALANAYLADKLYDEAIAEYKEAIKSDPKFIKAYKSLLNMYLQRENYEDALGLLKQMQSSMGENQEVKDLYEKTSYDYMAYCLNGSTEAFMDGNKLKAYDLLNKAMQIKPDFTFAYYTLGFFQYKDKKYADAETALNEALKIDPNFWLAYRLLGTINFEKASYNMAMKYYGRALALNPSDPSLYNDLGLALMNVEHYDEAARYLQEALTLAPDSINIRYSLASVNRDRANFDKAVAGYKEVISQQPDYPNVHNDLGDIYLQQGKIGEAEEEYNTEIKNCQAKLSVNPKDVSQLNNMAYAYNQLKEYNKAKEVITQAIAVNPKYRQSYLTLSKINQNLGQTNEALLALDKAKSLSVQTGFIDRDILNIRKEFQSLHKTNLPFEQNDIIYLKNGRRLKGKIKQELTDKVVLEVTTGGSKGTITLYRDDIELVISPKATD